MEMFSKLLTESDVKKSLRIASCLAVPEDDDQGKLMYMCVLDNTGKAWSFPFSVHRDESTGNSVLSVGWDEFVREKGIRANDKVVFKKKSLADRAILRVDVKRMIRLFGEDIWADI